MTQLTPHNLLQTLIGRLVVVLPLLLMAFAATASSYRVLQLDEMFDVAEVAFVGTVSSVRVESREGTPWSLVEFEVERPLLGAETEGGVVQLAFLGGNRSAGGTLRVSEMPRFEVGERVLILAYEEEYYSPIVGFNQGVWRYQGELLRDVRERTLGLDEEGRLKFDGVEQEPTSVIDAVARELEARR